MMKYSYTIFRILEFDADSFNLKQIRNTIIYHNFSKPISKGFFHSFQVVNVPSFIVRLDSQKHIDFSLKSPFGGGRAGRVKRKNNKKGESKADEDED